MWNHILKSNVKQPAEGCAVGSWHPRTGLAGAGSETLGRSNQSDEAINVPSEHTFT